MTEDTYPLSVEAAEIMWGPAPAYSPKGEPQWGAADNWRIVPKVPGGFHSFRPDCNMADSDHFLQYVLQREYSMGRAWNYKPETIIRQDANGVQRFIWRSILIRGHVIAGGVAYQHEDENRALAELVATLKLCEGERIGA